MDFETQEANFVERTINGKNYVLQRFSPTPALKLSARLAKFLGPAIAQAVEDFQKKGGDRTKMTKEDINIGRVLSAILPELDEELVAKTVKDLISCCSYENVELRDARYEEHFKTNAKNLFPLVGAVVEYQFADFLSGLLTGKSGKTLT